MKTPRIHLRYIPNHGNRVWRDSPEDLEVFGHPSRYIHSISVPIAMEVGEELIPMEPIITICRKVPRVREFFSKPLFRIAKYLRIQFHWDGIKVVGSCMEEPNVFRFEIPNKDDYIRWFHKIICMNESSTGFKPLYISVDVTYENWLLKMILNLLRYSSLIFLLSLTAVVLLSKSIDAFSHFIAANLDIGKSTYTLSAPVVSLLIVYLAFWQQINEAFKSIYEEKIAHLEKDTGHLGIKAFSGKFGVTIVEKIDSSV
jgi:hypothetical protein